MIQRCQYLRFAREARHAVGILREGVRQDFDSHVAVEPGVGGAPYLAHAALTEPGGNAVVRDGLRLGHVDGFHASYHFRVNHAPLGDCSVKSGAL